MAKQQTKKKKTRRVTLQDVAAEEKSVKKVVPSAVEQMAGVEAPSELRRFQMYAGEVPTALPPRNPFLRQVSKGVDEAFDDLRKTALRAATSQQANRELDAKLRNLAVNLTGQPAEKLKFGSQLKKLKTILIQMARKGGRGSARSVGLTASAGVLEAAGAKLSMEKPIGQVIAVMARQAATTSTEAGRTAMAARLAKAGGGTVAALRRGATLGRVGGAAAAGYGLYELGKYLFGDEGEDAEAGRAALPMAEQLVMRERGTLTPGASGALGDQLSHLAVFAPDLYEQVLADPNVSNLMAQVLQQGRLTEPAMEKGAISLPELALAQARLGG